MAVYVKFRNDELIKETLLFENTDLFGHHIYKLKVKVHLNLQYMMNFITNSSFL